MNDIGKSILALIISLTVAGIFLSLSVLNESTYIALTEESRGVEILTAIFYLFGGIIIIWGTLKSDASWLRRTMPILLGLFFIFIAGEEESWGQWIFEFSTPDTIKEVNYQGEVNIHNLDIFFGGLHAHFILNLFILSYGVIVPLGALLSVRIKGILNYFNIPIIPVYFAPAFITAMIYEKVSRAITLPPSEVWRHTEVMEFFFSVILLLFCTAFLFKNRQINWILVGR